METKADTTNRPKTLHQILITLLLVLSMLAGLTGTAMADPGDDEDGPIILETQLEEDDDPTPPQIGGDTPLDLRRYTVRFNYFYAEDETGPDWSGSDEMSFLFGLGTWDNQRVRETKEYGDVDTGEVHHFTVNDTCITPGGCLTTSPGIAGPIYLTGTAVENDDALTGFDEIIVQGLVDLLDAFVEFDSSELDRETLVGYIYEQLGDLYNSVMGNDHIGTDALSLSEERLAQAMPYVGRGMTNRMDMAGWGGDWLIDGDGHYRVYVDIRRVADAEPEPDPEPQTGTTGNTGTSGTLGTPRGDSDLGSGGTAGGATSIGEAVESRPTPPRFVRPGAGRVTFGR